MSRKVVTVTSIVTVSFVIGGILGYVWGYSNVHVELRKSYLSNATDNLDLQIPALKKLRPNQSISANEFSKLESVALADILIIRGLNPDIAKLHIRQVYALCKAESYFNNNSPRNGENKHAEALANGYLKEILPNLQVRLKKLGTSVGHVDPRFRAAMERKYHHPFPDKVMMRGCLEL